MGPIWMIFRRTRTSAALLLAVALAPGCSTAPHIPAGAYWDDQAWIVELYRSVQTQLHYPSSAREFENTAQGVVRFTYDSGRLEAPVIVTSTGSKELDDAILEQLVQMRAPASGGPNAATAHMFQMNVFLTPPASAFAVAMNAAVAARRYYPQQALDKGQQGLARVKFKYKDGKVSEVAIAESSGSKFLDQAAVNAVSRAVTPPPPPDLRGKLLTLQIAVCFTIGQATCEAVHTELQIVDISPSLPGTP